MAGALPVTVGECRGPGVAHQDREESVVLDQRQVFEHGAECHLPRGRRPRRAASSRPELFHRNISRWKFRKPLAAQLPRPLEEAA